VKATKAKPPAIKGQDSFANFMAARRRIVLKLVVQPMAEFEAFLANKSIISKPLIVAPLDPVGDAPATAIPIELESFTLGLQHPTHPR
jgi:hypothetical protein